MQNSGPGKRKSRKMGILEGRKVWMVKITSRNMRRTIKITKTSTTATMTTMTRLSEQCMIFYRVK